MKFFLDCFFYFFFDFFWKSINKYYLRFFVFLEKEIFLLENKNYFLLEYYFFNNGKIKLINYLQKPWYLLQLSFYVL